MPAGQTVSNAVVVPVSSTGTLCFYSPVPTDLVVDVNGWFAASSSYRGVKPSRVFDTRPNEPGEALVNVNKVKITPTTPLEVKVTEGLFTFVALDENHRPRPVDPK